MRHALRPHPNSPCFAVTQIEVEIADVKQLNEVLRAIGSIPGVHSVERV